jgi:phosphoribosylformylglycinamidine cyclo-ligase
MDSTFNNGLGMILVVSATQADGVVGTLKSIGEQAFIIGEIRKGARGAMLRG